LALSGCASFFRGICPKDTAGVMQLIGLHTLKLACTCKYRQVVLGLQVKSLWPVRSRPKGFRALCPVFT
jgi:hypothetical protein